MSEQSTSMHFFVRRSWFRTKLRQVVKVFMIAIGAIIVITAAENSWFGYAWRSTQLFVQGANTDEGSSHVTQSIMTHAPINSSGSKTILAVGDIARCPKQTNSTQNLTTVKSWFGLNKPIDYTQVPAINIAALAGEWPQAPILTLGDTVYRRGTPYEFADCFDPIWEPLKFRTLPAPGNHEYYTPGAYAYYDYWGPQAGPERRGYYSVKSDGWLILSLNSEIDAGPSSDQGRWLQETLAASTERCILGFYHRPTFSLQARSDGKGELQLFEQLNAAGASVILNGHNHFYERTHPTDARGEVDEENGTVSFIVGTGDRGASSELPPADFTANAVFGKQGMLRLTLEENSYSWAFHEAATGDVLDQGSRACNLTRLESST